MTNSETFNAVQYFESILPGINETFNNPDYMSVKIRNEKKKYRYFLTQKLIELEQEFNQINNDKSVVGDDFNVVINILIFNLNYIRKHGKTTDQKRADKLFVKITNIRGSRTVTTGMQIKSRYHP